MTEFTSPLKAWPGSFALPDPDDFSGVHWKAFKDGYNKPKRSTYADIHHYAYAGLELIAQFGQWNMAKVIGEETVQVDEKKAETRPITEPLPIGTVQSWETDPDSERIKLIAWIGREIDRYTSRIIDPKE